MKPQIHPELSLKQATQNLKRSTKLPPAAEHSDPGNSGYPAKFTSMRKIFCLALGANSFLLLQIDMFRALVEQKATQTHKRRAKRFALI